MSREMLRSIVADALQVPIDVVPPEASSDSLEAWDSLRHLDIILAVESKTGISFPTAEIVELTSIPKLDEALSRHGWKP